MLSSIHLSAFSGVMPQLVGHAEMTSTSEKPLPSIWFLNAFSMARPAALTFFTLLTATRARYSGPSSSESISQMRTG